MDALKNASGTAQLMWSHPSARAGGTRWTPPVPLERGHLGADEPDVVFRHLHLKFLISWHGLMAEACGAGIMGLSLSSPLILT